MKHYIYFPQRKIWISSGAEGAAIQDVKRTCAMCADQELNPGGVCAAQLELTLFPEDFTIAAGERMELYDEDQTLVGTFIAEKPERSGGLLKVTAWDFLSRLDADLTAWLETQTFPMSLENLAKGVAEACGLNLTGTYPAYNVMEFSARGVTGRQLMSWICQACGCFCAADPEGNLELRWLRDTGISIEETGDNFYYQGTLTLSDYDTAPIERVHIGLTADDTGVSYPDGEGNTLSIQGNYLLTGDNESLARSLYDQLSGFFYTPCSFETATPIAPGDIFIIEGRTCVAMTVEENGGRYRVSATGSASRSGSAAVCGSDFKALNGRILELQFGLQGVRVQMTEFAGTTQKVSELTQDVDAIGAQVSELTELEDQNHQQLAQMKLTSDALELSVSTVESSLEDNTRELRQVTERFRFDEEGLTISDSTTGMSIRVSQEAISFTGTTVITPDAMDTTNLKVGESLTIGDFIYIPRTNGNLSFRWIGGTT